jgi:type IV secretion system protein VirB4
MYNHTKVAMETLRDERASRGDRSLLAFYGQVQDDEIRMVLQNYIGTSKMANLFGADSEDFDDRPYLFFEMQQIDELGDPQFVVPAYFHVLHVIARRAAHKKPYLALFDEIWRAFVNVNPMVRELLLDFLIKIVRTIEKMNGTPVLCVHAPEDIEASDDPKLQAFAALLKRAIVSWIFLPIPRSVSDEQLASYGDLGLSKRERTLLRQHMQRARDYYYVSSEGRRPFELELSDLAKAFLISESRDDERRLLVRKLAERKGWIPRFLEEIGFGDYAELYQDTRPGPTRRAS